MEDDGAILLFGRPKPKRQREGVGPAKGADARYHDGVVAAETDVPARRTGARFQHHAVLQLCRLRQHGIRRLITVHGIEREMTDWLQRADRIRTRTRRERRTPLPPELLEAGLDRPHLRGQPLVILLPL